MPRRQGHGWWPYLAPIFSFLAILEIGRRAGPAFAPAIALASVAVPFGVLLYHAWRSGYPELRGYSPNAKDLASDIAVGIIGAALWVAPYLWIAAARPEPGSEFDPQHFGATREWLALSLRVFGYAAVTPFAEELFIRGWLARYADVFDRSDDFRDVPIGRYSLQSFATVVIFFTLSHKPWEWPVALLWIVLTQLWFYRRRQLLALIVVHAVSNLSIFVFVLLANGRFRDAAGSPLNLCFFL